MSRTFSTDDYEIVSEEDGEIRLREKRPRYAAQNWGGEAWGVAHSEHVHPYATSICSGCFPDAEARARRLAAELNGEIESAETIIREYLKVYCHRGDESCIVRPHKAMWPWLKAGEA